MKTRHIIAIGLLSATAIGILAIGIKTNKKNVAKHVTRTEATDYIENITKADNQISYQITGNVDSAQYINPNAINSYTFNYSWNINVQNTTYTTLNGSITLDNLYIDDQQSENIDQQITLDEIQYNYLIKLRSITITQQSFKIENTYNLTTNVHIRITYTRPPTATRLFIDIDKQFTYTLTNTYQDIENTQIVRVATYDINNNLNSIQEYGENQYNTGYTDGQNYANTQHENDYTEGYADGKDVGYSMGWNDSDAFNHPIALQPLMLQILSLPFTFLSKAFDVTLWPGTPYEFNFANFIKGLIAIASIMFIIKIFTSGFAVFGNYTGRVQNHKLTKSQIEYNKAKADLAKRTDPNNKTRTSTSHNTNVNINKKG